MPLLKTRSRARLTRMSTLSVASSRKRRRRLCTFLLAVALLLFVSVSIFQVGLGRTYAQTARGRPLNASSDNKHLKKQASGIEESRVNQQKVEPGTVVHQEDVIQIGEDGKKERAEMVNPGESKSMRWNMRNDVDLGVGDGSEEEGDGKEEGRSVDEGAQFIAGFGGRETDMNDDEMDDFEFGNVGEKLSEVQGFMTSGRQFQGQLLDDMDKFEKGQVMEDTDKYQAEDDEVPEELDAVIEKPSDLQDEGDNLKDEMVSADAETKTLGGMKEPRKLGLRGENGRSTLVEERGGEEQAKLEKLGQPVAGYLGSGDKIHSANDSKRTPEALGESVRAALDREMEKRNGLFSNSRALDDRKFDKTSMPPLGPFELRSAQGTAEVHYPDSLKFNSLAMGEKFLNNDEHDSAFNQKLDKENVKQSLRSAQEKAEIHYPDSLTFNALAMEEKILHNDQHGSAGHHKLDKENVKQSLRFAQETAEVHYPDSIKFGAVGMEKIPQFDEHDNAGNHKLDTEVSKVHNEHLESAEKLQTKVNPLEDNRLRALRYKGEKESKHIKTTKTAVDEHDEHDYLIQWGFYPSLSRTLKFSRFMTAFFKQGSCSLRVFMAWTTASWAYTPRHQRAIESLLHFHPRACIVVFTETIDWDFFESFFKEGYKIAVVRPNLEELLGRTPAIDFAWVWNEWRQIDLFYIHYTELLRIAALYKYGGVWLDMDVILARPLPKLQNTVGSTVLEDGQVVLNGAFMTFNKSSLFLKACIEEFTATYDETSLEWNGAGLLNRIARNATTKGGNTWLEEPHHLHVLDPFTFFPLSRHDIIRYFLAPTTYREEFEQNMLLTRILDESFGTHLWNSLTRQLVPEVGSLVEKVLNRFCMRCTDVL